jgi:dTDP-4-dehydrorhamnose reductase
MTMRFMITGNRGQLGCALTRALAARPECEIAAAVDLPEVDIADSESVGSLMASVGEPPDVVVNAAAFTQVDRCESEPELAYRANAIGPRVLAESCATVGSRLVHVSTDYVFPGDAREPYREEEATGPASVYGETKLAGEEFVRAVCAESLVVRTSWVFGEGRNFIGAILDQGRARRDGSASGPLTVVDDQRGRPTYAEDLAEALLGLVDRQARGLYHVANAGVASWWDLARESLDVAGYSEIAIDRIATRDLNVAAPRPLWSVLDCSKAERLGIRLRDWREAVRAYLKSEFSPAMVSGDTR